MKINFLFIFFIVTGYLPAAASCRYVVFESSQTPITKPGFDPNSREGHLVISILRTDIPNEAQAISYLESKGEYFRQPSFSNHRNAIWFAFTLVQFDLDNYLENYGNRPIRYMEPHEYVIAWADQFSQNPPPSDFLDNLSQFGLSAWEKGKAFILIRDLKTRTLQHGTGDVPIPGR